MKSFPKVVYIDENKSDSSNFSLDENQDSNYDSNTNIDTSTNFSQDVNEWWD